MISAKLSVKLMGGFIIVALVTLGVGFVGWYGTTGLVGGLKDVGENRLPSIQSLFTIKDALSAIRVAQRTLLVSDLDFETRKRQYDEVAKERERYQKAWAVYEPLPQAQEEEAVWKQFVLVVGAWKTENDKFFQLSKDLEKNGILNTTGLKGSMEEFRGDHYRLISQTANMIHTHAEFQGGDDSTQCALGKWMAGFKTDNGKLAEHVKEIAASHESFHRAVKTIKGLAKEGNAESAQNAYVKEMIPASEATFTRLAGMREQVVLAEDLYRKMHEHATVNIYPKQIEAIELLDTITKINEDAAAESIKQSEKDAGVYKVITLAGMTGGALLALALGFALSRSITRPIQRVVEGLSEGAEQVAAGSGQVSAVSQQLAEGASEQAAAIEETSSSLEEMSSMTKQNAESAGQANNLMRGANTVVASANESMNELTASMTKIFTASEDTQKIIKTIDEIAFQTNLLALNAAVEAARAGEAGAGFAVVADEVRNLAMRAADAAKNTAQLIEGTVKQVRDGMDLVAKNNEVFSSVTQSTSKVGELIGEIAAASKEQAQGIEQINRAVTEMDRVTQQNAANAEESASASEEMNAQAEQMKVFVEDLATLVYGGKNVKATAAPAPGGHARARAPRAQAHVTERKPVMKALPKHRKGNGKATAGPGNAPKTTGFPAKSREVSPEQLIPFDDVSVEDF